MSRLLFAAARGAGIEGRYHNWRDGGTEWRKTDDLNKVGNRIHPDDAHLEYGPISTALREMAEEPPSFGGAIGYPVYGHIWRELTDYVIGGPRKSRLYYEHVDELHRSLFLLCMAEALADSGL